MENPWAIPWTEPDYVLETDRDAIKQFNEKVNRNGKATRKDDDRIHLNILPEPFLGRLDAPVVLLNLNPGYSPEDVNWHKDRVFRTLSIQNLQQAHKAVQPFYLLDPAIAKSGGGTWWRRRTRELRQACDERIGPGQGDAAVANGLLCVEYFPYHSEHFGAASLQVCSQEYSFWLVQRAMVRKERKALIVVLRSPKAWHAKIPALNEYANYYILRTINGKTPQTPYLSRHLICDREGNRTGFNTLVDAICSHTAATPTSVDSR